MEEDKKEETTVKERTFLEWLGDTYSCKPIPNPFSEQTAMVLVTSMGRTILGGVDEISEGLIPVYLPLVFGEMILAKDPKGNPTEIGFQITKHFFSLKMLDWTLMRPDFIYVLKADRHHDRDMVNQYETGVKQIRGADSDIEIAATSDLKNIVSPFRR